MYTLEKCVWGWRGVAGFYSRQVWHIRTCIICNHLLCTTFCVRMCVYNVYMQVYGSSEVQQQLPTHVYTFSNVDREWRELMKTTAKNPAVINVCLKEGEKGTLLIILIAVLCYMYTLEIYHHVHVHVHVHM